MEKPRYVFLSYATPDKPVVEALARILSERKFSPWLDKWNLIPGEPWQEAIEKALEDCAACAVCLGPSGTGPWQNEEMRAAIDQRVSDRSRQFRVIPVLLPGSERGEPSRYPAFLRATTWVEFRETLDDEKALHRLISGIQGIPPGPDPGEAVAEGARPYMGLQVFDVGDARFFFGREALTEWLLDKLRPENRSGSRFLAIIGPSGSGKSSLARAGLLASLKSGKLPGSDIWPIAVCKPGAQPLESLAVALSGVARLGDSPSALRDLIRDLGADSRMLHLTTRLSLRDAPADRRLVVLIDQFEEVFTLCLDETQRRAIIENLLHAATVADGQTVVVLTLRADFYGRCAVYPDLAAAVSDRQSLVGPMTRDELQSAIERPAYLTGCEIEGGLADLLLNEVESQPGSLPLLEHALLQIWEGKEGGRRLTIAAYREIGGVAGALEKHAEEVYEGFSEEEKEACRQIFLRLVQVDEQGRATKRRLGLDELAPASSPVRTVVSRLTDARLLTTDQEEELTDKKPTVELAHEALLSNWARLKQWIEQDREALRTRRRLDEAVAEWLGKNRDPAFLLEGGRLAQVEEWAERHPGEIGADARELLTASIAGRDRERRRLRKWTIASIAAAVVAIAAAITASDLWHTAVQQRSLAEAENLAATSVRQSPRDRALGLLLSIKAVRLADFGGRPHLPSAEESLRSSLSVFRGSPLPTGRVRAASISSDRRWLAVVGTDGFLSLWELTGEGPVRRLNRPAAAARSSATEIVVGTGGKWLLTADEEGSHLLRPNATEASKTDLPLKGEDWLFGSDPFSPDGRWLLTRQAGDIWMLRALTDSPRPITTLKIQPAAIAFSPDGQWLAALESEALEVRSLPDLRPRFRIPGVGNLKAFSFSSDSKWVVAADPGHVGSAQAWKMNPSPEAVPPVRFSSCTWSDSLAPDTQDPLLFSRIPSFTRCFGMRSIGDTSQAFGVSSTAAALDHQGRRFAKGSEGGEIWIGNLDPDPFSFWDNGFQSGPIRLLSFQGQWLISQGGEEPPRGLEILPGPNVAKAEPLRFSRVLNTIAVSPQGWRLSLDPETHTARLWTSRGSQPIAASEQASSPWIFSPDGYWLAAAGPDGRPRVWRLSKDGATSSPISFATQYHHATSAAVLAFSPDLHWLASGDQNGEARLWSLQNPNAEPLPLTNSEGGVAALAFRSDGSVIATAARNVAVRLRDLSDGSLAPADRPEFPEGRLGSREKGLRGSVTALTFLRDGRLALGGTSDQIKLWHGDQREVFLDSTVVGISMLTANPQGTRLASFSSSGEIQIWSLEGRNLLPEPVRLQGSFKALAFTADGNGLWTVDMKGDLRRWELRTDKLLETACRAAGRNLTESEWNRYIPSEPYQEREPCPKLPKAFD